MPRGAGSLPVAEIREAGGSERKLEIRARGLRVKRAMKKPPVRGHRRLFDFEGYAARRLAAAAEEGEEAQAAEEGGGGLGDGVELDFGDSNSLAV